MELDLNRAVKDKIGRPGQRHMSELTAHPLEIDLQRIAAADHNIDRSRGLRGGGKNQGARDNTRAAGQSFIFHSALIGADSNAARAALLAEIGVGAAWFEQWVMTEGHA